MEMFIKCDIYDNKKNIAELRTFKVISLNELPNKNIDNISDFNIRNYLYWCKPVIDIVKYDVKDNVFNNDTYEFFKVDFVDIMKYSELNINQTSLTNDIYDKVVFSEYYAIKV